MHISASELIDALRGEGFRITGARRAVCDVLAGDHDQHLTAADIHEKASQLAEIEIDPSTVYRTLDVLEGLGLVHHVHLGHGPGIVHLADGTDHHHLVCETCGRSIDVPLSEFDDVFAAVGDRYGFAPTSLHFALLGMCSQCDQLERQQL